MKLHNTMEEEVIKRVEYMYNDESVLKSTGCTCTCMKCKLDTTAYVLNRLKPRYVVSERGVIHAVSEQGSQLNADINLLILEGMKKVFGTRSSSHTHKEVENNQNTDNGSAFNFPIFFGSILDGNSFEPLKIGKVTLSCDDTVVKMLDDTWGNPYNLQSATKGTYAFWAKSITTEHENVEKTFNFQLEVSADNYEPTRYAFTLPLISDRIHRSIPKIASRVKLDTLYLFPVEL